MLVDSHCHLNMLDYEALALDADAVIAECQQYGIERLLCISVDRKTLPDVLEYAHRYASVYASVGVHPSEAAKDLVTVDELIALSQQDKVVAIGETGLDYYYNDTGLDIQRESFARHIQVGLEVSKPIIVHTRAAHQDTIALMQSENARDCGGVMHCFTESWQMAKQALDMGFYISFSGIVTFKNAKQVQEVAAKAPMDRILVETDSPYLTPVPHRGKPNSPAHVRFVAEKIAEIKKLSYDDVVSETTKNFFQLFSDVK